MRKYQLAWEAIKNSPSNTAQLEADIALHARVINGIRKEKARDFSWKLLLSERGLCYKLVESIEGKIITFSLVEANPINIINL